MPPTAWCKNVTIEIERCVDCHAHTYCTRHDESKYSEYEKRFRELLMRSENPPDAEHVITNPGPKSQGITCAQNEHCKLMWRSLVMDPNTRRWNFEGTFRYPRLGGFEITVKKGRQKIEVFSKLKKLKWPNPDWLLTAVEETVEKQLGGWEPVEEVKEVKAKRKYRGVDGQSQFSDEDLRELLKKKFQTLAAAFRQFDKNGDGQINRGEFFNGLQQSGVDLPPPMMKRLWEIADEDNSGVLHYTEFARKFCAYKATHTMHRGAAHKSAGDALTEKIHGAGTGARMAKTTQIRASSGELYALNQDEFTTEAPGPSEDLHTMTIQQLARRDLSDVKLEDAAPAIIRAKIYQRHGNLLNAFRQMDNSGDSRISYDEFLFFIPKVLGEPLSQAKMQELWRSMDRDMTGEIDIDEFASNKIHDVHSQGIKVMKDLAVDPTLGQRPDHQKQGDISSGLGGAKKPNKKASAKSDGLGRPDSASTIATETSRPASAEPDQAQQESAQAEHLAPVAEG